MLSKVQDASAIIRAIMKPRPPLRALTGIRFFAAFHVVLFHFSGFAASFPWWVQNIIGTGFVSVSLFFVLSGFILSYTYLERPQGIDKRGFWGNRFARIFPVYFLGLLIALPLFLASLRSTSSPLFVPKVILANVLLAQAWFPPIAESLNGPGWSLSAEAFFYLLFPFVALPLLRIPKKRLWSIAAITWLASLVAPTSYYLWGHLPTDGSESMTMKLIGVNPALRFFEFLLGMIVAKAFLDREPSRDLSPKLATIGVVAVAGITLAALSLKTILPYPLLHNSLLSPAFALLIYILAQGRGVIARVLGSAPLVLLGESSYSLYLLHQPLGEYAQKLRDGLGLHGLLFTLFGAVTIAALVLISIVVFRFIEEPSRRSLRRLFSRPRMAPPTQTPAGASSD